jgi:hypothetical protein
MITNAFLLFLGTAGENKTQLQKSWQEHTLHKWHNLQTLCKMYDFVKVTFFTGLVANKINT